MTARTAFTISMSDADRTTISYILGSYSNGRYKYNCVSEYSLKGGPENPFETLSIVIPRHRLRSTAPDLENDIVAGRNIVYLNAVGHGEYTVVKCKYSGRKYKLTCYCSAERFRGSTLKESGEYSPTGWVDRIRTDAQTVYGVTLDEWVCKHSYTSSGTDMIAFEEGTNVWYILQICALIMRCKIWFADGKAYVVDQTDASNSTAAGVLDLYSSSTDAICQRVIGDVTLGDEGMDSVINSIKLSCTAVSPPEEVTIDSEDTTERKSVPYKYQASVEIYGEYSGGQFNIPELKEGQGQISLAAREKIQAELEAILEKIKEEGRLTPTEEEQKAIEELLKKLQTPVDYNMASSFANNYMAYRAEPQQTVTFEVKEIEADSTGAQVWVPLFDQSTRVDSIVDEVNEFEVNNKSRIESGASYQKLLMSQYERHYPDGTTEYTFGLISNIDLSSSTSQILTALNSN